MLAKLDDALLLNLQTEIDVTLCADCEECCQNWNGSKRRREVLFFDVHLSRRISCQILDYISDRYASESEVHLGMGKIRVKYHAFMDVMACMLKVYSLRLLCLSTTRRGLDIVPSFVSYNGRALCLGLMLNN